MAVSTSLSAATLATMLDVIAEAGMPEAARLCAAGGTLTSGE
jgi:hypothetical protein